MAPGSVTPDDILRRTRKQPFRPFRIHMSDGACFDVSHPELAIVFHRRVTVLVPSGQREGLMATEHDCAFLHMTRIEDLAEAG